MVGETPTMGRNSKIGEVVGEDTNHGGRSDLNQDRTLSTIKAKTVDGALIETEP